MFFFFGREKVYGRESPFFGLFWVFSRAKLAFHACFFPNFELFSRAYFFFTRVFFGFFHGRENRVSRAKLSNLTGVFTIFFHVYQIFFHVCDLPKNSRAKTDFHVQF